MACGTGLLRRHLRGDVVALDESAGMLAIAAERLPDARIDHGDAVRLPFADGDFEPRPRSLAGELGGRAGAARGPLVAASS